MRSAVCVSVLLAVALLAGCGEGRLERTTGDEPAPAPTSTPAAVASSVDDSATGAGDAVEDTAGAADGQERTDVSGAVPTVGLSEEEIREIETALVDAEALLASIEAELAESE